MKKKLQPQPVSIGASPKLAGAGGTIDEILTELTQLVKIFTITPMSLTHNKVQEKLLEVQVERVGDRHPGLGAAYAVGLTNAIGVRAHVIIYTPDSDSSYLPGTLTIATYNTPKRVNTLDDVKLYCAWVAQHSVECGIFKHVAETFFQNDPVDWPSVPDVWPETFAREPNGFFDGDTLHIDTKDEPDKASETNSGNKESTFYKVVEQPESMVRNKIHIFAENMMFMYPEHVRNSINMGYDWTDDVNSPDYGKVQFTFEFADYRTFLVNASKTDIISEPDYTMRRILMGIVGAIDFKSIPVTNWVMLGFVTHTLCNPKVYLKHHLPIPTLDKLFPVL